MIHWQQKKGLAICLLLAIALHWILFLTFLNFIHQNSQRAGTPHVHLIHSYLFPWTALHRHVKGSNTRTTHTLHKLNPTHTPKITPSSISIKTTATTNYKNKQTTNATTNTTAGSGQLTEQGNSELLTLIHNHIQQYHFYPPLAAARKQTGTVWLQFQLLPTGKIQDINIVQSSGNSLLDQAAQHTLTAASPMTLSPNQVQQPMSFTIRLVYNEH